MNVQAIGLGERVLLVAPMAIGVLAAVALVGLALWVTGWVRATRSTKCVRHGQLLELAMTPASALGRAAPLFPAVDWVPTNGDGSLDWAHRAPGRQEQSLAMALRQAEAARQAACAVACLADAVDARRL
ncbi:MAG: hypothetical protein ABI746_11070 [Dermatophilaceae bacterium]